jgi:uncharacterized repeat protein (TIGR01451 family)
MPGAVYGIDYCLPKTPVEGKHESMRLRLIQFISLSVLVFLSRVSVRADIVTVTSAGSVGTFSSQAIVNGNPAMSYLDTTISILRYVRAGDVNGNTWNPPVIADGTVGTGLYTSLAVVAGNPAISYYDSTNGNLLFVRATDADGATWAPFPALVDSGSGDDVGLYTSLAVVAGNPTISYYDATNQELKYVRATDANGTAWGSPIVVDTASVGRFTSLAVVAGNPAISYYDSTNGDLRYVRATDANGTAWAAPVSIDTGGIVGEHTSLVIVNGNPAITYFDNSNGDLKYVRAADANGATWNTPIGVDVAVGPIAGAFNSLSVVNGFPAISYYDGTGTALRYVRATNANGSAWNSPITVDNSGFVGQFTSLVVANGFPAISYYDSTNADLKFARACDANGTSWLASCTATITLAFANAASNAVEAAGFGNLLRVTTSDTNPTAAAVTVSVGVTGGTATAVDYNLTGTITIPAGTAHNALVSIASGITITDETLVELDETASLQLSAPSGAVLGAQTTTTHTIANDDTATVSIIANDPGAAENPTDNGQFTITMSAINSTGAGIMVNYTATGSAVAGTDYTTLSGSALIPNGSSSVTVDVLTAGFDDSVADPAETVIVTLNSTSSASVTLGTPSDATVTIADDETAGYLITPLTPATISEAGGAATFTIRLTTAPTGTVTLDFTSLDVTECFPSPPTTWTFDNTNWNAAVTATFNATNDTLQDGTQICPISITRNASSTAAEYIALPDPLNILLRVVDDEAPIVPTSSGGSSTTASSTAVPQIQVFDPAISKLGFLVPAQLGARGEQIEWVVTVSNVGAAAGNNVVITDTLRPELKIDRVNALGGTVSVSGQIVTVTFATIQPGQTFQFSIFTTVTDGITVDNTACVQAAGIATECVTAPAIAFLPNTGETPLWAHLLRGLAVLLVASSVFVVSVNRLKIKRGEH